MIDAGKNHEELRTRHKVKFIFKNFYLYLEDLVNAQIQKFNINAKNYKINLG